MKKILFIFSSTEFYSGAEVVLFRLATSLRRNFNICGIFPNKDGLYKEWTAKKICSEVISFIPVGRNALSFPRFFIFFLVNCIYVVRLFIKILCGGIDLVHVNDIYNLPAMIASKATGKRVVCHVHAGVVPSLWLKKIILKLSMLFSNRMVFVSKAVRQVWFDNSNIPAKATVIHNIHPDPEIFSPSKYIKQASLLFTIGMTAKMCREKGHRYFIEAAALLKEAGYKDFKYFIIGGKLKGHEDYYEEVTGLIKSRNLLNEFVLYGMTPDVPRLMSEMDVFVHTPDFEDPFPTVVIEAMMMEKPVVCFDIGGISEQFIDGESGILVPYRDVPCLVEEIKMLHKNPSRRKILGRQARLHALNTFNENKIGEEFTKLYKTLFRY